MIGSSQSLIERKSVPVSKTENNPKRSIYFHTGPWFKTVGVRRYRTGYGWLGKPSSTCVLARESGSPVDTFMLHLKLDQYARRGIITQDQRKEIDRAIHMLDRRQGGKGSLERIKLLAEALEMRLTVK